ncbi:SIR2 family NAD-dependent protein deacylase [Nannocystis punicea]|uniref:protein acetyllysine N-acetyltransferase n=1 Tax=Nannocystis punicea TaxID=2995304 RepID=A0ABY7H2T6_9BACT|nr:NAD-dependent deacylase [Nannocystis poenicansa]WAS93561.1 NAD-dependent deacylase [Nannocystis poenicansa]
MPEPRLRDFKRIVFFTGAGMSAESGVPTYRGAGGIWKEYDYRRYACQDAFNRDPEAVWEFHNYRRGLVAACSPNRGHHIVARAGQGSARVTVVTQNIDGLHALAGSREILELHGNLWRVRCDTCNIKQQDAHVVREELQCDRCGGWWRPDIVWFGDYLHEPILDAAQAAILGCDLFVSIGTSAVVYPAAYLPEYARKAGAVRVEINPDETPASDLYDVHLRGPATEMLARLAGDDPELLA